MTFIHSCIWVCLYCRVSASYPSNETRYKNMKPVLYYGTFIYHGRLKHILLYIILFENLSFCIPFSSETYPFVYHSRLEPILVYTTPA